MQDLRKRAHPQRRTWPRRAAAGLTPWPMIGCLTALWLAGCGAGAEGKGPQEPGAQPATVADTTARFDQAERDLRDSLGVAELAAHGGRPPGPAVQPSQPGDPPPAPPPSGVGRADETSDDRTRCQTACRALASMERSADRLCGLAGEQDPRCEDVRSRVSAARRLVHRWCPDCRA